MIKLFKPVWKIEVGICYGIGKHGDSPGTRGHLRSPWDTLHPDRDWAHQDKRTDDEKPRAPINLAVLVHYKLHPPLANIEGS